MKTILLCFILITSLLYGREVLNIKNAQNGSVYSSELGRNIYIYHASVIHADFDLLFVNASLIEKNYSILKNPNTSHDEYVFQMLIDVFYGLLKTYDIISNKPLRFCLATGKDIWRHTVLVIGADTLRQLSDRTFDEKDTSKARRKDAIPPLFPLRKFFQKAKIFINNGNVVGGYRYSSEQTEAFQKYLKKHVFINDNQEFIVDDAYKDYFFVKKNIYSCCKDNDIDCVKRYIKYKFNINKTNKQGLTPLFVATISNHFKIVKLLIDHGADPDITLPGYENAYLYAKRHKYTKIASLLEPISKVRSVYLKKSMQQKDYTSGGGSRYITNLGPDAPDYDYDKSTKWYKQYISLSDGTHIFAKLTQFSSNGCYHLLVGGIESDIYGSCSNCSNDINGFWSCAARNTGQFSVNGNPVQVVNAVAQRSQ